MSLQTSIPIYPATPAAPAWPADGLAAPNPGPRLLDRLGRPLTDLRISVTDRCNFRCPYCMPRSAFGPGHRFMPMADLLSFEEVSRVARLFVALGVRKLRLTGGEPLLRKDLPVLVAMLHRLSPPTQPLDIALTTNGTLLAQHATALKEAGLTRVTVSLDALAQPLFRQMSDSTADVAQVLQGIEAAQAAGLGPVKVNMVVRRGLNDHQIVPMARHFKGTGVELRLIEYMDVGSTNQWQSTDVVPANEMIATLCRQFPLHLLPHQPGETARRLAHADGTGVMGVIASITEPFCGDCSRMRLSSDGRLHTCLFSTQGHDLRGRLRRGEDDTTLTAAIRGLWSHRADRYSEQRASVRRWDKAQPANARRVEMSTIGG